MLHLVQARRSLALENLSGLLTTPLLFMMVQLRLVEKARRTLRTLRSAVALLKLELAFGRLWNLGRARRLRHAEELLSAWWLRRIFRSLHERHQELSIAVAGAAAIVLGAARS